jgi:TolB protein
MSYDSEKIDYAWSPNSGQLLYMNFNKAYKINADGTGLTEFAEAPSGRAFTGMDWSSHPNHVVARVRGNNHYEDELYLINAQGVLQPLRADEPGALGNPMFSVDGTQVLYSYDQSGSQNPNGRLIDMQLFIMEVDNPSDTRMLDAQKQEGTNDIEARFSSTGGKIICTNVPNDGITAPIIYQIDIDGIDRYALFIGASMADMR